MKDNTTSNTTESAPRPLTVPEAYRLLAIRSALKLEALGMRNSRGVSALKLANEEMKTSFKSRVECLKHYTTHRVSLGCLVPARNNS